MIANMLFKSHFPVFLQSPINCGAIAMIGGLIIVPLVSLISKKLDDAKLANIFACYDKTVTVNVTDALAKQDAEN